MKRDFYGAREIPASNFGTYIDGDKWQPADLSNLAPSLTDEEFEDSLSTELWPALVKATLKRTRASLPARDVALFDAIRKSGQVKMSAKEAGVNSATTSHRVFRGWSELADNPGTRPSPKQSVSSSSFFVQTNGLRLPASRRTRSRSPFVNHGVSPPGPSL